MIAKKGRVRNQNMPQSMAWDRRGIPASSSYCDNSEDDLAPAYIMLVSLTVSPGPTATGAAR